MITAAAIDALSADLLRRVQSGDANALRTVERALARGLQPHIRRAERDGRLRKLAAWRRSEHPGATDHLIASILHVAGERMQAGRLLDATPPFGSLGPEELHALEIEVRWILSWAPARSNGDRWPGFRQMQSIIKI